MSRCLFLVMIFSFAVAALPAQDKGQSKPNTLTAKEIAEGCIMLFDGETTFGWDAVDTGKWTVAGGMLAPEAGTKSPLVTRAEFNEFELSAEYVLKSGGEAKLVLGADESGRERPTSRAVAFRPMGNRWHKLLLSVTRHRVSVHFAPIHVIGIVSASEPEPALQAVDRRGHIGLIGSGVVFRDLKLKPLGLKPIFNGKDLSGWQEVKTERTKSVYSVTEKGELNVKNGPGDLQTEGQWDDFILQMDVISNGKHLNSGVFFRALPGEFWLGYEAQIRNQWQGEDRTKPVDFGTGGIYNRQPARRVISSDNEWFTMTVIAHGNHLATWVNGYPVADFSDTRPANRSARNGTKTDKGVISLQGHDPGTDLSFRNLRIAELPKSKSP